MIQFVLKIVYEFVSALFVQMLHYFGFTIQLALLSVLNVKVNLAFDKSKNDHKCMVFYGELHFRHIHIFDILQASVNCFHVVCSQLLQDFWEKQNNSLQTALAVKHETYCKATVSNRSRQFVWLFGRFGTIVDCPEPVILFEFQPQFGSNWFLKSWKHNLLETYVIVWKTPIHMQQNRQQWTIRILTFTVSKNNTLDRFSGLLNWQPPYFCQV
mgnify:FL=1